MQRSSGRRGTATWLAAERFRSWSGRRVMGAGIVECVVHSRLPAL